MSGQSVLAWRAQAKRRRTDRRTSVRFAPTQEIVCYCGPPGPEPGPARVCDISSGGACLLIRQPVAVGDLLRVELINGPHTFLCSRDLRVLRVFNGTGNDSVIAGEFDRRLGYEELLPFIV